MLTHTARYAQYDARSQSKPGHLTLVTDLTREPVYLKGRVKNGPAFAAAMLVLGKIVKTSLRTTQKDHSAYQEWVQGKYLEEIEPIRAAQLKQPPGLQARQTELRNLIKEVETEIRTASEQLNDWTTIKKFYNWLYDHDREAWIVIDPIVSVQPDATFFEGFSVDESVYVRVRLPSDCIDSNDPICTGTTNIDFSLGLENEFSRIRTYRPLDLTIGAQSVSIETDVGAVTEKKIELPESWVRGLLEVQSALSLSTIRLDVSPAFVAEIISKLEAEREKHGPRSLRFKLTPGEYIRVEIEPWGDTIEDREGRYEGNEPAEVRLWGRRRLLLLKDLLPDATSITVHLLGSGMPSFWTVRVDEIDIQLGLSGWTTLDWASRARFAAFVPSSQVSDQSLTRGLALLKSHGQLTPKSLSVEAGIDMRGALAVLHGLCSIGKAMFDADLNTYRWRELYPEFKFETLAESGLEERMGVALAQNGAVEITQDVHADGHREVTALVTDNDVQTAKMEMDADERAIYAECTCPHFRYHKLREGPCRHMIAVTLA